MTSVAAAPIAAANQKPIPTRMPIAAVTQIEAADGQSLFENNAGAEKSDACHDALRHARGIGADGVGRHRRHPFVLVDGHDHQQR
jgi:hypothetical protein